MIGLIDCEALSRNTNFIPNLEIMKLYAYYKNEGLVRLLFDDSLVDACSAIYLRKETEESRIPYEWLKNKKVFWGGKVFTNGIYVPLSEKIEKTIPNYRVYNNYIKDILTTDLDKKTPELQFLDYSFVRLYNGYPLQSRHIREGMPLLIYDDNLFEADYEEKFLFIQKSAPSEVYYTKPIVVKSFAEFAILQQYKLYSYNRTADKTIATKILLDINPVLRDYRSFILNNKTSLQEFGSGAIMFPTIPSMRLNRSGPFNIEIFEKLANMVYFLISHGVRPAIYRTTLPAGNVGRIFRYFTDYINTPSYWGFSFRTYINRTKYNEGKKTLKEFLKTYPHLPYLFSVECMDLNLGGTWYGQFRN